MRTLIGRCGVDSGQIMIVDPCYVIDNSFGEQDYEECCAVTSEGDGAGQVMRDLAVVTTTGIGDGYYPVYATTEDLGGWGERITRIEIDFTDHVLLEKNTGCERCGVEDAEEGEDYCWRCAEHLDEKDDEEESEIG
jgi:hypothetical protein